MARKATGQVIEPTGGRGWALRFRAYGKRRYVTLGTAEDGWDRRKAERELRGILADVERGIWQPEEPAPPEPEPRAEPTFHQFASEWFANNEPGWRPKTVSDYRWALELHLLPALKDHRLSAITAEEVDRYKARKLRQGKLAPNSINKTILRLAQILEVAVEYGKIERNPAKGKRRRVKATEPKRSWIEPEQLPALLDVADHRLRPLVATLAGAGLRIGEACALDWADVNLATGTITVGDAKTPAGIREVDMPMGLREELATWRARSPRTARRDPVFVSRARNGRHSRQTPRNAQARLRTAIKAANKALAKEKIEPIPESVTPHALRRLYASIRAALRDDPVYIAEQLGHRDARFTFRVYQRAAKRRERLAGTYLVAFDRALEWSSMGSEWAAEHFPADSTARDSEQRDAGIPR